MSTMHPLIASAGTGLGKALHKLGVPDWVCWTFLALIILFYIIRRMSRSFDD